MCECDSVRLGRKGRVFLASILPASRPRAASLMVVRRMLRAPAPSMPVYKNYLARCPSHTMHIGCLTFLSNVVAYVCRLSPKRIDTDGRFPTTGCPNDAPSGQGSSRSSPARCPIRPTAGAACCAASRAKPHFSGAMAPENSIHRLPHSLDEPTNKRRKGRKPPILRNRALFDDGAKRRKPGGNWRKPRHEPPNRFLRKIQGGAERAETPRPIRRAGVANAIDRP